jgi:hypothetical protein
MFHRALFACCQEHPPHLPVSAASAIEYRALPADEPAAPWCSLNKKDPRQWDSLPKTSKP